MKYIPLVIIFVLVIIVIKNRCNIANIINVSDKQFSEIHTIILWNTNINKQTKTHDIIYKYEDIDILKEDNIHMQGKPMNISSGGVNTDTPFTIFVLKNNNPIYIQKQTHAAKQLVNKTMFDIKSEVRGDYSNFQVAHGSFNVEETREVLTELNMESFMDIDQPVFNTLEDMFERLDKYKVSYVIERSFSEDDFEAALNGSGDIDIITDDYYKFKSIVNGINIHQDRKEKDNGYVIRNEVKINTKTVLLDIRFSGDEYYPTDWINNILKTRVHQENKFGTFYIPTKMNQIFMLYYHTFIHHPNRSKYQKQKHINTINNLIKETNLCTNMSILKVEFCKFLDHNKYTIKTPEDKGVPISLSHCTEAIQ